MFIIQENTEGCCARCLCNGCHPTSHKVYHARPTPTAGGETCEHLHAPAQSCTTLHVLSHGERVLPRTHQTYGCVFSVMGLLSSPPFPRPLHLCVSCLHAPPICPPAHVKRMHNMRTICISKAASTTVSDICAASPHHAHDDTHHDAYHDTHHDAYHDAPIHITPHHITPHHPTSPHITYPSSRRHVARAMLTWILQ